jgi:RNA polymerase sigma-70 factor (ECF subfamily)
MLQFFEFDDEYVRRLKAKDRETEEHFVWYFRNLLLAVLRRRVRSADAADDICQDVFFRVLRDLPKLREGAKLPAFVLGYCRNCLNEYYRGESRTVQLEEPHGELAALLPNLDDELDNSKRCQRVRRVIEALHITDPRDADILRAILRDDDKDEICRRFDVDRNYLRVLLHRAKQRFRDAYLRRPSGRRDIDETFRADSSLLPRDDHDDDESQ